MIKEIAIGIIGAGRIAKKFAEGISHVNGAYLYAVASREQIKADSFADEFGAKVAYDSYEKLVADSKVDLIYIATPNGLHKDHTLLCLKNKKHVICEKPFTSNRKELEELIKVARVNKVFLMEAMWIRYFPVIKQVRQFIEEGNLGSIKVFQGDFGFRNEDKTNIKYNRELAGGALMDVGIYPISFASMIFGKQPKVIKAVADIGKTGIDEKTSILFSYEDGAQALMNCAITTVTPRNVYIIGEKGIIYISNPWFAEKATISLHGEESYEIICENMKNGYHFEIEEAVKCIRNNQIESKLMSLDESLEIMNTLDRVRVEIGLEFIADK